MKKNVLISVIVPIYNVDHYLERCLNSIISQTYKNLEIILVDDGSSDNSSLICDKYQECDKRIRIYHKKNGGLSSARNYGLDRCHGDYIGFVDSDDFINEKMYEVLLNNLIKTNSWISIGKIFKIKNDFDLQNVNQNREIVLECYSVSDKFKKILEAKDMDSISVCNKLYDKKIFNKIRFPIGKMHEDAFVMPHILDKAEKIVYTSEDLYYYFIRDESISHTFTLKRLDDINAMKNIYKFFSQKRFIGTNYKELAYKNYVNCLIKYFYLLKHYNKKNQYKANIDLIKEEFDNNYKEIVSSNIGLCNKLKYFLVRYFPSFYIVLKKIDMSLIRRDKKYED